ncbi:hypothetical protein OK006_9405 [Actinobacteria bacterium OK006]|nr:hypothetical protein OK006_9405 [Actinobacteria bacterium OK006]
MRDKLPSHRRGQELPRPHRVDPSGRRGAAEQNDEWTEARRYTGLDLLTKARLHPIESESDETALPTELTAQPQNEITERPSIHHSRGRDQHVVDSIAAFPALLRTASG